MRRSFETEKERTDFGQTNALNSQRMTDCDYTTAGYVDRTTFNTACVMLVIFTVLVLFLTFMTSDLQDQLKTANETIASIQYVQASK